MFPRVFVALLVLAFSSVNAASDTTATAANSGTFALPNGTNVFSNSTLFLGTEYDPNKCVLQFASLQCTVGKNTSCANLNGYPLECVKLGIQNGKQKTQCNCAANETDFCQNSTAPGLDGVPQFGDCSDGRACVDAYGHVPTSVELKICAEKIHCVKEINTTASVPAQICHTCRSCIAQNDATGAKLSDKRRFDCTKICPQIILDSIAQRNKKGVGIADNYSSSSGSESSSSQSESGSGSLENATTAPTKKSAALASLPASTIVGSIVLATLSVALVVL